MPKRKVELTKEEARVLVDDWDIQQLLNMEEEASLLQHNHPALYDAYKKLYRIAYP